MMLYRSRLYPRADFAVPRPAKPARSRLSYQIALAKSPPPLLARSDRNADDSVGKFQVSAVAASYTHLKVSSKWIVFFSPVSGFFKHMVYLFPFVCLF
ncbi:hypothetical protein, partial [Salmonella enterica]|uniref:hypothetical protein n=1 Tax=Salmonella enterica TaxID=28901 RepID=UPI00352CFD23